MSDLLETYLGILAEGYYEVTFAFEGMADENVWRRPAPGLLSVGELAGHVAYWEAVRLAGGVGADGKPDLAQCKVSSPLIDHRFHYLEPTLAQPPTDEHRAMTAEQVCRELVRVHEESVAHFRALNPDLESTPPGYPANYTYRAFLTYAAFHVAYHTGQMYTARHLFGETPPDN
jgi:hypothetical protein